MLSELELELSPEFWCDSMNSDRCISQPTQLLQHALAPAPHNEGPSRDPKVDGDSAHDFSLDSRVIPIRPVMPRYDLQSPSGRVLVEDSQKENLQGDLAWPDGDGSGSVRGGNSISAHAVKVIGTNVLPSSSPPTSFAAPPMHKRYRRSPSLSSQDSFAGPISQDPAEKYLATTKQFDVPLSDLGETPTQEVIHSPTDPALTLPDASEHHEFLEIAMREYDAQRANRLASNCRPNVLVAASPAESSDLPQHEPDGFLSHNGGPEFDDQESRYQFGGSSSFDKMLDRGLGDVPDPTPDPTPGPTPIREVESMQADELVRDERTTEDDILTPLRPGATLPFEWTAPTLSSAVASSNPRSLLRMVHPANQYRIAKMMHLAGQTEPPPCFSTGAETQPSGLEETQPCDADDFTNLDVLQPSRPTLHQNLTTTCSIGHHPQAEDEEPEDALDVVPDSEPLRAGPGPKTRSLSKKPFRPLSPMSEHGSDLVPDSLEAEESEADVPLAIEAASKQPKKSAVPVKESVAVHSRNTRSAHSINPAKEPVLTIERQPQRPTSSRTSGKNSGAKGPKTELLEVPTSLPEQDLQDRSLSPRRPHIAAINRPSSKAKAKDPEISEPSRAHTNSAKYPAAIKSVRGNKRSRKSDSESEENSAHQPTLDEGPMKGKMRKEEDEDIGSSDHHVDVPPPPPLKSDVSRKKRQRTEAINSSRGLSKASTSRNKSSETPAVVTRSAKRLRSGISSTLGLAKDSATRVFALWKQDGHYYSGVIYSEKTKNKYLVRFDDGTEDEVELRNMRCRELLVGDRVIIIQDNIKAVISDLSHTDSQCSFTVEADNGIQTLGFREIRIANRTIQAHWKGRGVLAENIITVIKPKSLVDTTPSKQSVASMTSGQARRELAKTGFVVTINPKNEDPDQIKEKAMRAIKQHGGVVLDDWSGVFTMEGRHSQPGKRWIATPGDVRWKPGANVDRVFLLSDDAHQKPKFLLALALGIPCLSFEWLTTAGRFSSDWQPYLLPAGYSDTLGARVSQLVDLDWGNCTEHLTDIMENEVPIKLFSQKSVLCIGAELVPKKNNAEEASRYVPWIILCMGAAKVEAIADTTVLDLERMKTFDYIIVKEKSILKTVELGSKVVVGDVNWVKECLVSARLSPPKFD